MLPIWLVTTLPTWLVIFIVLYALAALYVAIKFREVRKFLAGAFFVSSGILWYLWLTGTSVPLVMPYVGTVAIEPPDISGQRAIVHFILFLLCFYFGFISNMNPLYKQLIRSTILGALRGRFGTGRDGHMWPCLLFAPVPTRCIWQSMIRNY
jgi:hypothetical protein